MISSAKKRRKEEKSVWSESIVFDYESFFFFFVLSFCSRENSFERRMKIFNDKQ